MLPIIPIPPIFRQTLLALFATLFLTATTFSQTTTLYTKPADATPGGITARVDQELTHAIALNRDRVQCFNAALSDAGKSFRFTGLPIGKYDLILVTKSGAVFEGLDLGEDASHLPPVSAKNALDRITKADTFFNKAKIHRAGLIEEGDKQLLFVERLRDKEILEQSGEVLKANLRRLEVVELIKAADDWQFLNTRHVYREEAPVGPGMTFFAHTFVPGLGNIRVIDSVKDLGSLVLPK